MKTKKAILIFGSLLAAAGGLTAASLTETFQYPDGSDLMGQGSWVRHTGTGGGDGNPFIVSFNPDTHSGTVSMASAGIDLHLPVSFTASTPDNSIPWSTYIAFDLTVTAAQSGDFFLGLGNNANDLRARLYASESGEGYTLGYLAGTQGNPSYTAQVLEFGQSYRIVFRYDMIPGSTPRNNQGLFYIDPTDTDVEENNTPAVVMVVQDSDPAVSGLEFGGGFGGIVLRQGEETAAPTISALGNLVIADNFSDAAEVPFIDGSIPVLQTVDDLAVAKGETVQIQVSVSDADSTDVSISGEDLPDFVQISDNGDKTADISISPSTGTAVGDYLVTVVASDGENSGRIQFMVTVYKDQSAYYCDPANGNIANDGTAENPWPSLAAVFAAGKTFSPGSTVYLLDGHHGSPNIQGHNAEDITIKPLEGHQPTLRKVVTSNGSRWILSGLTISPETAGSYERGEFVQLQSTSSHITLENCFIYSSTDISGWAVSDWLAKAGNGIQCHAPDSLISGNHIKNVYFGARITASADRTVVRSNTIENFSADGIVGLSDYSVYEYNLIMNAYKINDNHDDGFQSWSTGPNGVGDGVVRGIELRGNIIINHTDPEQPLKTSLQGIGCFDGMFEDWIIENNVIIVNQFHGLTLMGARDCVIVNNTVIDLDPNQAPNGTWLGVNHHKSHNSASTENKARYASTGNIVRKNLATGYANTLETGTFENNLTVPHAGFDDYFVSYPYDLRLKQGSPAIDAGVDVDSPSRDINGVTRPQDGDGDGTESWDAGAYEYVTSWYGFPITDENMNVDTGVQYMGVINVMYAPWIYIHNTSAWAYLHIDTFSQNPGAWVWFVHP